MRGTTLNTLIQMLRRELKIAESPALGSNTREGHAQALRSAQERLYADWDWPFKVIRRDVPLAAGQRYYGVPSDMDLDNIRSVELLYSGLWTPLRRGICSDDYNAINSDDNQRSDPAEAWDVYNDPDGGDMIEIWPIPVSNGQKSRFNGIKKLSPLIADSDRADLDDTLLVLMAAIDFAGPKDLTRVTQKAERHYLSLRRNGADTSTFINGGGSDPRDRRGGPGWPRRIVITPASSGG